MLHRHLPQRRWPCQLGDNLVLVDGDNPAAERWNILLASAGDRLGGRAQALLGVIDARMSTLPLVGSPSQ
jgi:hypothetical protein